MNVTLLICPVNIIFNPQDLPEHFEDKIHRWMNNFLILLSINGKVLKLEVNSDDIFALL